MSRLHSVAVHWRCVVFDEGAPFGTRWGEAFTVLMKESVWMALVREPQDALLTTGARRPTRITASGRGARRNVSVSRLLR